MSRYEIQETEPSRQQGDIVALLRRNLEEVTEDRFRWIHTEHNGRSSRCWIVRDADSGAVVGTGSIFPRGFRIGRTEVPGGVAGDFAIDRQHRSYNTALLLQRNIVETLGEASAIKFSYGIPNAASAAILRKVGYRELGEFQRFVKFLTCDYKAGHSLIPTFLPGGFARIVDFGLKRFTRENWFRCPEHLRVERLTTFDGRFDTLWERACQQYQIVGVRDAAFLNWRYVDSPQQNYEVFALVERSGELAGYIVYFVREAACTIVDLLCIDSEETLDSLLAEFSRLMRREGVGSISIRYLGGGRLMRALRQHNYVRDFRNRQRVYFFQPPGVHLPAGTFDATDWHFLEGDNDV